jgi:hypothetical protein
MLIDVAIPGDRNVIKKEAGKILKYKDLIIEIQAMWNMKAKVIPVTIRVSGQQHAPAVLYLRERSGTHCIGGWVGPRSSLEGRTISPQRDSIPRPSSP